MDGPWSGSESGHCFDTRDSRAGSDLQQPDPLRTHFFWFQNPPARRDNHPPARPYVMWQGTRSGSSLLSRSPPRPSPRSTWAPPQGSTGFYRAGSWLPIRVDISNDGPDIDGKLVVRWEALAFEQRVALPAPSRKSLEFYVHAGEPKRQLTLELLSSGNTVATETLSIQPLADEDRLVLETPWCARFSGTRFGPYHRPGHNWGVAQKLERVGNRFRKSWSVRIRSSEWTKARKGASTCGTWTEAGSSEGRSLPGRRSLDAVMTP